MYDNDKKMDRTKPSGITYTKAAIASDDLYGYLASSKETQPKAQSILAKYGYEQAETETDLAHKLSSLVMNVGESALKDIAMIHPDKELILSLAAPHKKVFTEVEETTNDTGKKNHNDCGCGGNSKASSLNDCGCGGSHNASGLGELTVLGEASNSSRNDSRKAKHVIMHTMHDNGSAPQYFALQENPVAPFVDKIEKESSVVTHNMYIAPAIVIAASILIATFIWKKL